MYKSLLINVSVSLIVSGVQPHMTEESKLKLGIAQRNFRVGTTVRYIM